jgi:hypothetical protein
MYISLRVSRENGFKQWSDSLRKYSRGSDAEEGDRIVISDPPLTASVMTAPSPLAAEKSL